MFQKVMSAGLWGIDGFLVSVEADIHDGLPGFAMTGNLSQETKEAQERVRVALKNGELSLPPKKITVNLSPADVRKDGTAYDLAVAAAVLGASGLIQAEELKGAMLIGELGLDGRVKPVRGVLSLVCAAREGKLTRCFLPRENALEGSMVEGVEIVPVESLKELVAILRGEQGAKRLEQDPLLFFKEQEKPYEVDFSLLNGQPLLRRATEVAVAGRHNILYIGPAGAGKTMAAKRIPTIMPLMSREESIRTSKIYSVCGLLPADAPLLTRRPFRSPHHTITATALAGGGTVPKPGEISLASGGVLFLDELPEFSGKAIEILRQPLEDRAVTVSRLYGSYTFPADTMVAAAMNPCPCGFYPDRRRCTCTSWQIKRYIGKISRPILDRIDITVEASPVTFADSRGQGANESSAKIRERVHKVQQLQRERFAGKGILSNGEMRAKEIEQYCRLKGPEEAYLEQVYQKMELSVRGCHKILKVARTIADLDGKEEIGQSHLYEAVGYRSLEEKYW